MLLRLIALISVFLVQFPISLKAQKPYQPSSSEIYQDIKKLNVLGSVLYVAAHPDDENTRFIGYCANEKLFNTRYLSITRGDGGQNLIGSELRVELGIIRTQELLAARRIDGGQQSFTRANDFGFSKTTDETLRIWDKQLVLADVVWAIRLFQPDIVVCRFPTDSRAGHGHHSASAQLAIEAYDLAADPKAFPEQMVYVKPWQAKRIVTNTGRWWSPEVNVDDPNIVSENLGGLNVLIGKSYNELAALSRSQHKSQGFGTTGTRGELLEYFEHIKGERADSSVFEGIAANWSRVGGASAIAAQCEKLAATFDLKAPEKSVPALLELRKALQTLPEGFWTARKLSEVDKLIQTCLGLYLEAKADAHSYTSGDSLKVTFEAINRSSVPVSLNGITCSELKIGIANVKELKNNILNEEKVTAVLPSLTPISQPFWLDDAGTEGTYSVNGQTLIHLAESEPRYHFIVTLSIKGEQVRYRIPLIYKWNDPVQGESYRPVVITPPALVRFAQELLLFSKNAPIETEVIVTSAVANLKADLLLTAPDGWTLSQTKWPLHLSTKGEEQRFKVTITPSAGAKAADLKAAVLVNGTSYSFKQRTIAYDHIPTQVHFPKAEAKLVLVDIKRIGERIGYVEGAGDGVADGLRILGYTVDELTEADLTPANLAHYQAVLTGIRFLNVNDRHTFIMPKLLEYAQAGGNVIMQYNTSRDLKTEGILPYPLTLGRDRVTEEQAEVRLLQPNHPALSSPNRISAKDFEGWKQERGLYFPSQWDANYSALLSMNDTNETAKDGSLLVANFGKGHFVYTGISFFRQLPEGVPGAYRLLVNLISLEKGK
jgi:LmbE family N-acetylglucosaminyl deacetylase